MCVYVCLLFTYPVGLIVSRTFSWSRMIRQISEMRFNRPLTMNMSWKELYPEVWINGNGFMEHNGSVDHITEVWIISQKSGDHITEVGSYYGSVDYITEVCELHITEVWIITDMEYDKLRISEGRTKLPITHFPMTQIYTYKYVYIYLFRDILLLKNGDDAVQFPQNLLEP